MCCGRNTEKSPGKNVIDFIALFMNAKQKIKRIIFMIVYIVIYLLISVKRLKSV